MQHILLLFATICTKYRAHYFGEITHGTMHLSNQGVIADVCWHEIKNHAQNIELDTFIVMPNHIHGILILLGNNERNGGGNRGGDRRDKACLVSTDNTITTNTINNPTIGQNGFRIRVKTPCHLLLDPTNLP